MPISHSAGLLFARKFLKRKDELIGEDSLLVWKPELDLNPMLPRSDFAIEKLSCKAKWKKIFKTETKILLSMGKLGFSKTYPNIIQKLKSKYPKIFYILIYNSLYNYPYVLHKIIKCSYLRELRKDFYLYLAFL